MIRSASSYRGFAVGGYCSGQGREGSMATAWLNAVWAEHGLVDRGRCGSRSSGASLQALGLRLDR